MTAQEHVPVEDQPLPVEDTATCFVCGCSRNVPFEERLRDLIREMRRQLAGRDRQIDRMRANPGPVEAHPVVVEVAAERARQTAKHGDESHLPDGTGPERCLTDLPHFQGHARHDHLAAWAKARTDAASQSQGDGSITFEHILTEEWAEAIAEQDPQALRAELVQVAAVAVQWIEALDLRATTRHSATG